MPFAPMPGLRHGGHDERAGVVRVRAEALRAVQDVLAALLDGGRARRARVGARARLGEAVGAHVLAGDQLAGVVVLEEVVPPFVDGERAQGDVRGEREAGRSADAADLLDREAVGELAAVRAAVLLREGDAGEAEVDDLLPGLGGEAVVLVDLGGDRRDLGAREVAHHRLDHALVVGEVETVLDVGEGGQAAELGSCGRVHRGRDPFVGVGERGVSRARWPSRRCGGI
jgi:hypothetical protein